MENLSASDVALMTRNNDGFGLDGGYGGMFGLLVLLGIMNGGFGGWGNNNFDRYATQSDVQYTSQFGQILDGNRDIMNQANNNANNIVNAVNQSEYETIASMKDAQLQLQDRLAGIQVSQADMLARFNDAIGNTRLEIAGTNANLSQGLMQNKYEYALGMANLKDAVIEEAQKTRDMYAKDRMADMQNEINNLKLAQATCGLMRFPTQWTYGAGFFPPFPPYIPPTTTTSSGTTTA